MAISYLASFSAKLANPQQLKSDLSYNGSSINNGLTSLPSKSNDDKKKVTNKVFHNGVAIGAITVALAGATDYAIDYFYTKKIDKEIEKLKLSSPNEIINNEKVVKNNYTPFKWLFSKFK